MKKHTYYYGRNTDDIQVLIFMWLLSIFRQTNRWIQLLLTHEIQIYINSYMKIKLVAKNKLTSPSSSYSQRSSSWTDKQTIAKYSNISKAARKRQCEQNWRFQWLIFGCPHQESSGQRKILQSEEQFLRISKSKAETRRSILQTNQSLISPL